MTRRRPRGAAWSAVTGSRSLPPAREPQGRRAGLREQGHDRPTMTYASRLDSSGLRDEGNGGYAVQSPCRRREADAGAEELRGMWVVGPANWLAIGPRRTADSRADGSREMARADAPALRAAGWELCVDARRGRAALRHFAPLRCTAARQCSCARREPYQVPAQRRSPGSPSTLRRLFSSLYARMP